MVDFYVVDVIKRVFECLFPMLHPALDHAYPMDSPHWYRFDLRGRWGGEHLEPSNIRGWTSLSIMQHVPYANIFVPFHLGLDQQLCLYEWLSITDPDKPSSIHQRWRADDLPTIGFSISPSIFRLEVPPSLFQ